MLVGKDDPEINRTTEVELQVRLLVARYLLSVPLAVAIAELAFSSGRGK
ncbi:hypothetical protein NKH70_22825 [Mesorhizobium sp. M0991]